MRIGILFSGGKDSVNTLWYYREQAWDVAVLLSLIPKNPDSFMFQQPHERLLTAQAEALGVRLLIEHTPGHEDAELDDLRRLLARAKKEQDITGVAVGALASDYQHERVTRVCHELGLKTFSPLWHKSQEQLLRELVLSGFDVRMTRIAADGLSKEWLGKRLTTHDIDKLVMLHTTLGLHVGGEGGEYETIVLGGPLFSHPISVKYDIHEESTHRAELVIIEVGDYED